MNWKEGLFKPKWQHKNAAIRLQAVTTEQHPQFFDCLLDIAGQDEDPQIRCAAIKRLHQLENILQLHAKETDLAASTLLATRIFQLAISSADDRPLLELRVQVANTTTDRKLIEQLAQHAPEAELRRAAIARIERQGLLGDCSISDDNAQNRRYAASRISQQTTLKRVIAALRKKDKVLYTELQQRLQQELLQRSDPGAVQAEALRICLLLEHQVVETEQQDIAALHAAWKQIAAQVTAEMTARYERVCERLAAPKTPKKTSSNAPSIDKPTVTEADPEATSPEPVKTTQAEEALDQASPVEQLKPVEPVEQPKSDQVKKRTRQHLHLEQLLTQAGELLNELELTLEQGELQTALAKQAQLQQAGKKLQVSREHRVPWQKIKQKLAAQQPRLRELRDWHHWSNNKIRKRLIAEMEVLPAVGLHPDALLDRMKALQAEWKSLEASEQILGDRHFAAAPWMWRKFNAAGHLAFETTRSFLDKRGEIQSRNLETLTTFCTELKQLTLAEPTDWSALGKALNRGRKKLHELKNLPAHQRQKLAKQLKSALDKANSTMQGHYQQVEKAKMKLIRSASQLEYMAERSEAISQAKSLQSQWQQAGSLWRSREQALWNQFREHLDPLFAQLKEQQESARAAIEENRSEQTTLITDLQAILESGDDLPGQGGKVQGLQDGWKAIARPERRLQESFQSLLQDYQHRVNEFEQQAQRAAGQRWWLKSELLHQLASLDMDDKAAAKLMTGLQQKWPVDSSDTPVEQFLDHDYQNFIAGKAGKTEAATAQEVEALARALCIRIEFIAGLPSPTEEREQRMQYQVDRLAESMSGELTRRPAIEEAEAEEQAWLGMYALAEPCYSAFAARVKQALSTILEKNNE